MNRKVVPCSEDEMRDSFPFDRWEDRYDTMDADASPMQHSMTTDFSRDAGPERLKALFIDASEMKETVRRHLMKPTYSVFEYYHDTGLFQRIAKDPIFENITLIIIALNAIWISIDTDLNSAAILFDADPVFQIAEHSFCTYFTLEWYIRFASFKDKTNGLRDRWFVFDSVLVLMMVLETWVMTTIMLIFGGTSSGGLGKASILRMARLLRLTRMARMARLLRTMPELMILIKGMIAATRSVFFTLCLLIILLYVFGIAFKQMSEDTEMGAIYFNSVPEAMYSLLVYGTFMDNLGEVTRAIGEGSALCAVLFWMCVLFSALTVMNMLIGVLCEVVSAVAATERETLLVNFVKSQMHRIMASVDANVDEKITKSEFLKVLENGEAAVALHEVGVDPVGLVDSADSIFDDLECEEGGEKYLSFVDFMEKLLELRGCNNATVKNIVDLGKSIKTEIQRTAEKVQRVEERLKGYKSGRMASVRRCSKEEPSEEHVHLVPKAKSLVELKSFSEQSTQDRLSPSSTVDLENMSLPDFPTAARTQELHTMTSQLEQILMWRRAEIQRGLSSPSLAMNTPDPCLDGSRQRVNLIPGGQRQPRSGSPSELEHLRAQLTKMLEVTTRLCELNLLCPGGGPPHAG